MIHVEGSASIGVRSPLRARCTYKPMSLALRLSVDSKDSNNAIGRSGPDP